MPPIVKQSQTCSLLSGEKADNRCARALVRNLLSGTGMLPVHGRMKRNPNGIPFHSPRLRRELCISPLEGTKGCVPLYLRDKHLICRKESQDAQGVAATIRASKPLLLESHRITASERIVAAGSCPAKWTRVPRRRGTHAGRRCRG
jgi:hypothetical protein